MKIKKVMMRSYQLQLHCDCGLNLTNQAPRINLGGKEWKYTYVCPVCGKEHETKEYYGAIHYEEVPENEEDNCANR